jgi:hypothetical protein
VLINQNDLERFKGQIKIPQIGGIELDGFAEVTISKSTGVAFVINTTFEGKFYEENKHFDFIISFNYESNDFSTRILF